jgi:photosystem II stability/assembly factor-like uncharacterized protein
MKKLGVLILIITVCFAWQFGTFAESKPVWTKLADLEIKHSAYTVGFLNQTYGITAGFNGECHYTMDGGKTWPKAENHSLCRYGLEIVNENIAWNCGNGNSVRLSKDGGRTWIAVTDCGLVGTQLSFINEQTGWIANANFVVATNDGGVNWARLDLPTKTIGTIALLSETVGYVLDKNVPVLYATKDAGKTWATQKLDIEEAPNSPVMRWLSPNQAIIVGFSTSQRKEIALVTLDGGKTWQREVIGDKLGAPFLSKDGKILTLLALNNQQIGVYRREETK